jgi:hypothetical protein
MYVRNDVNGDEVSLGLQHVGCVYAWCKEVVTVECNKIHVTINVAVFSKDA